jgi:hypothetical protein
VGSGCRRERVRKGHATLGAPANVVKLLHVRLVHELSGVVPHHHSVVYTETRGGGSGKDVTSIGGPLADRRVGRLDGGNLAHTRLAVVDIDLSLQVSKSSHKHEACVGREKDGVARTRGELVNNVGASVKDRGLGGYESVNNTKLLRVRRPSNIVNRTFLIYEGLAMLKNYGSKNIPS